MSDKLILGLCKAAMGVKIEVLCMLLNTAVVISALYFTRS